MALVSGLRLLRVSGLLPRRIATRDNNASSSPPPVTSLSLSSPHPYTTTARAVQPNNIHPASLYVYIRMLCRHKLYISYIMYTLILVRFCKLTILYV